MPVIIENDVYIIFTGPSCRCSAMISSLMTPWSSSRPRQA